MPRLFGDPIQPTADTGIVIQGHPGLPGHLGVGLERDIGDGIAGIDQEIRLRQPALHDIEGLVALALFFHQLVPVQVLWIAKCNQ